MMRKFLVVALVGALAVLVAAPAMALDFKFGAEYRVRLYDYANVGFAQGPIAPGAGGPGTGYNDPAIAPYVKGTNLRGAQVRIRPRFDVSDDNGNIQATLRFEYGDTEFGNGGGAALNGNGFNGKFADTISTNRVGNGAGGGAGADGVGLETKWAYIDAAMPFNIPLRLRAGIQPYYLPKGLIWDDDDSGIRVYGKVNPVSYEAFWARLNRGTAINQVPVGFTSTAAGSAATPAAASQIAYGGVSGAVAQRIQSDNTINNAQDVFGGKVDFAIMPAFNPSVYYLHISNSIWCTGIDPSQNSGFGVPAGTSPNPTGATCASTGAPHSRGTDFAGASFVGKTSMFSYDFDVIWGASLGGPLGSNTLGGNGVPGGTANYPAYTSGWAMDGGIHFPIGPVTLNLVGSWTSGDNPKRDKNHTAFPYGPGPSWSGPGGAFELIGEGGAFDVVNVQHNSTGMWVMGLWGSYYPVKPLMLKMAFGYAGFTSKRGNCIGATTGGGSTNGAGVTDDGTLCIGPAYDRLQGNTGLGYEFHVRADYEVWTGFKIQGMAGWLFPAGDCHGTNSAVFSCTNSLGNGTTKNEAMSKYILQFLYNF